MKKVALYILTILSVGLSSCRRELTVVSPDQQIAVTFSLTKDGVPQYSVSRKGQVIITPSALGFITAQGSLGENFRYIGSCTDSADDIWETVWGEERYIRNHYKELTVQLLHKSGVKMNVIFRVFNDGWALRYAFPTQKTDSIVILHENTCYTFAQEPEAWSIPWRTEYYEALWEKQPLSVKDTMCSPITLEMADGTYSFLHEAALFDYPAQNFYVQDSIPSVRLGIYLTPWQNGVAAYEKTPFDTPWRMMIMTNNLKGLIASRVMLNLNNPCKIEDTSWIKPMKFIGIWWGMHLKTMTWHPSPIHGATTANMKRYIDFAADNNFEGVLAEGWNQGWEAWAGVDTTVRYSFVTPYPDYDINYLADYAHKRGVEIIFHHETQGNAAQYEREMDEAYAYMEKYGMHAVKTGYVAPIITTVDGKQYNRSQSGVRHYRKAIETAAKHHVCIDNHEPVMPTGLQRTYPNLMTQEGIRGQEWNAWSQDGGSPAEHVTVLPFTRMLAGPADYTPGVFAFENPVYPNTRVHATLANQLALFVVLYSPLQMACDLPENYQKHSEAFQFIKDVPCDWEQSVLLNGAIGDYVSIARQDRHSADWYIGAVSDEQSRTITLDWSFLPDGVFCAQIYRDAADADWKTNPYAMVIETREIRNTDAPMSLHLASGGGCAIRLYPRP